MADSSTADPRFEAAARKMFEIGNERTGRTVEWDTATSLREIYLAEAERVLAAADEAAGWEQIGWWREHNGEGFVPLQRADRIGDVPVFVRRAHTTDD